MSLTRKVALNTAAQIASRIVQTAGGLILLKLLSRYLGVEGTGELSTIFAYVGLVGIFADMGFFLILVREITKQPQKEIELTNNVVTMRGLFGILLFTAGFGLVWFLKYPLDVKWGIGIYSLAMFWPLVGGTIAAVFQSHFRIDKAALGDIVRTIANLAAVAAAIRLDAGLTGVVFGYLIGNFLGFAVQFGLLYQYVKFRPAFDIGLWRRIIIEALPMGLVTILGFVYFKIDTLMLSLIKTSTDVGIYTPAYKIMEVIAALPAYFMSAVMPIYSSYIVSSDPRIKDAFQRAFDALAVMAVPIVVGTVLTAPSLVRALTTEKFVHASTVEVFGLAATSATVLQVVILTVFFQFLSAAFSVLLIAAGFQKKLVVPYIGFTLFNIFANLLVIPKFSYIGTAATTVLTEIIVVAWTAYLVKRHMNLSPRFNRLIKGVFAALIMGVAVYFVRDKILIALAAGVTVYPLALYLVKGVNREDILSITKI